MINLAQRSGPYEISRPSGLTMMVKPLTTAGMAVAYSYRELLSAWSRVSGDLVRAHAVAIASRFDLQAAGRGLIHSEFWNE